MGLRIELAQIRPFLGDVERNLIKHKEIVETSDSDCVVFPELSLTGYVLKDLAFELFRHSEKAVEKLADAAGGKCVVAGAIKEVRPGVLRNSAAVIINGEINYVYKFYLPTYGLFEERRYFQRGDPLKDLKVFQHAGVKFGVIICEDAWHPEPAEALALMGADLILVPAASPMRRLGKDLAIQESWEALLKAHALMNTVWMAFVNTVGSQEEEFFWGGSMVVSPLGEVKLRLKIFEEDRAVYALDMDELRRARFFSSFRDHISSFHKILAEL
ncbi:Amidohydrolase, putative [Thermoproteus uzoniensis 768-20]|uniref:Amidohydrolase, putative n=1 Tax=Thermoproteus uzoniensis (strain 768-20) TaxID=999630 RepID=F2L298_THEU7|nr:nitrilase-related carbon-nitrogen hydrolase [Thermoproteus uzoniensis]AEA11763.1 Amidohydrolase, putative [Thermoproteus uzoniensis 768-20]